jgi:hypothetical protein
MPTTPSAARGRRRSAAVSGLITAALLLSGAGSASADIRDGQPPIRSGSGQAQQDDHFDGFYIIGNQTCWHDDERQQSICEDDVN